jgi:hypothetical protein
VCSNWTRSRPCSKLQIDGGTVRAVGGCDLAFGDPAAITVLVELAVRITLFWVSYNENGHKSNGLGTPDPTLPQAWKWIRRAR